MATHTLVEIEKLAREYAAGRKLLARHVQDFKDGEEVLKRRHLPIIKRVLAGTKERYGCLLEAIRESKLLFGRPRTYTFNGIRVGWKKQKGKLTWEDDEATVRLIEKHFAEQAETLIITKRKPAAEALASLTAAELKRIGVRVEEDTDVPYIGDADTEIDKLVKALFKDEEKEEVA